MNLPFEVICIDDTNKPNDIPLSKWVKKGNKYTVIEVSKMRMQDGLLGFKLEEVNIDDCFPYQYFAASRFAVVKPDSKAYAEKILEKIIEEINIEESSYDKF